MPQPDTLPLLGLYELRQRAPMTMLELADKTGLNPRTIARLEQDEQVRATPSTIRKLAAALGVTVEALYGETKDG